MSTVRVTSIAALGEFRAALCNFGDEAKNALTNVEMEIRRINDWLNREQMGFWQAEIKRQNLAVSEAQAALFRRKLTQSPGSAPNDAEYKEALRDAKRRLERAEEKLKTVKKWVPLLQRAIAEYHSRAHPLGDLIAGDLQNALVLLDRMVAALDAYTRIAAPSAPAPAAAGGSSANAPAAATMPTTEPQPAPAAMPEPQPATVDTGAGPPNVDSEETS